MKPARPDSASFDDRHVPAGSTCRARIRAAQRKALIDKIEELQRKPNAGPILPVQSVLSTALSMFVPGPDEMISADGIGVWLIQRALRQSGYQIVPIEAPKKQ